MTFLHRPKPPAADPAARVVEDVAAGTFRVDRRRP